MLDVETSKKITDYINNRVDSKEFETWLYEDSSLESKMGIELYLEFVSIDYSEKDSKYKIQKLIDGQIDFASIHKLEILETLKLLAQQKGNARELFLRLNYYASIGYYFLSQNDLIANFGEQGKSIILSFEKVEPTDYWNIIRKQDFSFFEWVEGLIMKLEKNKIVFTNERHVGDYGQISYKYEEK